MPAAPPTPPPSLSYELFPPRGPAAQDALLRTLDALAPTAPDWVSVTTGVQADRRAGCLDLLEHLVHHTLYRPLAHVIATGSTRGQLRELTARILDLGVRGILALRGDRPAGYVPGPEELPFARHLVELVREVEREHRAHLGAGRLAVGVAAYPVRHPESPSALHDIEVLLAKERAGADFAITQVCQDPQDYVRLRARAEQAGVGLPLVAGILPVTSLRRYERVCALAGLAVDERFAHRLETAESETQRRRVGVARAREQALAAMDAGAPGLHLYTFNEHPAALELLEVLDLPRPSLTPRPPLGRRSPVETARGHLPSGSQPLDEEILPAPATEKQRHPGPPDRSRHPDHPHTRDTRSDAEETTVSTTDRTAEHTEERAALSTHGAAACPFPAATVLGYPRIGPRRELKRALERRWSGNADAADLASEVTALRVRTVARLRELGLTGCSAIPASFALYDQVLDAAVTVGAIPARFDDLREADGSITTGALSVRFGEVEQRGIALTYTDKLDDLKSAGKVTIAIGNEPPYTAVGSDGKVSGAGPDVAREVFKRLGVADVEAVRRGVDMFDCVYPTRTGRFGYALTDDGRLNLNSSAARSQLQPIDAECDCYACRHYTRAYLAHLLRAEEMLAPRMLSLHNLRYLHRLVERAREAIAGHFFEQWSRQWAERYFKGTSPEWFTRALDEGRSL